MKLGLITRSNYDDIVRERDELRLRLEEAEETVRAIRRGEVDALIIDQGEQSKVAHIVEQEVLAQSILEQVADAVIICDDKGTVLRSSRAVNRMFPNETVGEAFDQLFQLYPAQGARTALTFDALAAARDIHGLEVTMRDYKGEDSYYMLSAGTLHSIDNHLLGLVVTLTDINARKEAEEQLYQADRRKDEFLATLAHELRNPLAPLQNALKIMDMSDDRARRQQAKDIMTRQLAQMIRLVDDLMDVSRITRNMIELKKDVLNLSEVMEYAIETSRPLMEERGHQFSVTLPSRPVYVDADMTRLAQIFSNLLNNAAKYTPNEGRISMSSEINGNTARVTIADNGIGIASSMQSRIFEMFTQADTSIERSYGGLGIGLTLVKNLLALHGGTIEVRSEGLGHGSAFTVSLPLHNKENIQMDSEGKITAANAKPLRIMVLDDNQASAQTIGWTLELLGHEYDLAFTSEGFLEKARAFQPDVILMDIGLPGKNGYVLCQELRQQPEFANTLLIAQTGWSQEKDRLQAKEAGFNHHLVKPINLARLEEILSQHRAA